MSKALRGELEAVQASARGVRQRLAEPRDPVLGEQLEQALARGRAASAGQAALTQRSELAAARRRRLAGELGALEARLEAREQQRVAGVALLCSMALIVWSFQWIDALWHHQDVVLAMGGAGAAVLANGAARRWLFRARPQGALWVAVMSGVLMAGALAWAVAAAVLQALVMQQTIDLPPLSTLVLGLGPLVLGLWAGWREALAAPAGEGPPRPGLDRPSLRRLQLVGVVGVLVASAFPLGAALSSSVRVHWWLHDVANTVFPVVALLGWLWVVRSGRARAWLMASPGSTRALAAAWVSMAGVVWALGRWVTVQGVWRWESWAERAERAWTEGRLEVPVVWVVLALLTGGWLRSRSAVPLALRRWPLRVALGAAVLLVLDVVLQHLECPGAWGSRGF